MKTRTTRPAAADSRKLIVDRFRGTYGSFGYRSVRVASGDGRSYTSYPGSTHDESDRKNLIAQSRDFMRNNAIYKGMIERAVDYIVGSGFEIQVTGGTDKTNRDIEALWRDWYKKPEIRNLLSGEDVAQMIMRELIVAGDSACVKTDKGLIRIFESEQLANPRSYSNTFSDGIQKDIYGRPMNFNLCPWKKFGIDNNSGKSVPAASIIFITNPERPSQVRGVPACQSVFPMLHRINDVCDSEAIAWQLLSRIALSVTRQQGDQQAYTESKEDPNISADDLEGKLAQRLTELQYALIYNGAPGDEVKGIERNIPGMNFSESLRTFLRLLGLALGLPLELVLLDWTKSNYSQSRAVLEQAYRTFKRWQHKLRDFHYQPLFDWKMATWRKSLTIGANRKITVNWIAPEYPWIDQLKEAQAHAAKVERGFATHSQVCKSLGTDRDEVVIQREKEVRNAIEISQKIKKDTDVDVPYQIFCGLKVESAPAAANSNQEQENPNQTDQENEDE